MPVLLEGFMSCEGLIIVIISLSLSLSPRKSCIDIRQSFNDMVPIVRVAVSVVPWHGVAS